MFPQTDGALENVEHVTRNGNLCFDVSSNSVVLVDGDDPICIAGEVSSPLRLGDKPKVEQLVVELVRSYRGCNVWIHFEVVQRSVEVMRGSNVAVALVVTQG